MEQARYWNWTKRKHELTAPLHHQTTLNHPTCYDSWEEQAFAEDAAGGLGGCIWPPRSYTCTFCRREFRSAQALGGHMNVHRRDRARLKQSPNSQNELLMSSASHDHNNGNQYGSPQNSFHPSNLVFQQYPSPDNPHKVCTLVCIPNPNSIPVVGDTKMAPSSLISPISSPDSRVSGALSPPNNNRDNSYEKNLFPQDYFSSPSDVKKNPLSSPNRDLDKDRYDQIEDRRIGSRHDLISNLNGKGDSENSKYVENDLTISLDMVVCRKRPSPSSSDDDKEEEVTRLKRRKKDASTVPLFLESNSFVDVQSDHHVLQINPCSIEEPDLELRLGN